MNKALPIVIVIAAVGLIGGYLYFNQTKTPGSTSTDQMTVQTAEGEEESKGFVGSIKDALSMGTAMECTFSYEGVESKAYIKNDKVFYQSTFQGKTSYVITKDNCTWTWSDDEGMKICYEPEEGEEEEFEFEEPESASMDVGEYEYDCKPAVINDEMFTPPSDIEFLDPMQMIPEGIDIPPM